MLIWKIKNESGLPTTGNSVTGGRGYAGIYSMERIDGVSFRTDWLGYYLLHSLPGGKLKTV